jgi:rubrerythrin
MGTALSAFEILTLAVSIERDSVDFYRKASRRYDDEKLRKTFLLLANWEQRHKELFATMKKELTRSPDQCETFDVFSFVSSNPQVLASMAAAATRSASQKEPSGKESKQDILDLALDRERIIIRFYTDLVGIVRDSAGKNTVDDVIKEEKRHVVILKRSLALLNDTDSSGHSE